MAPSKHAQSNQVLTFEWRNPLLYHPLCRQNCCQASLTNNTLTTWHFLIKAPYLGKLSVMYDAENVGLSHFSSDENKGLQLIAEIRCSALKSLITGGMVSIRLVP